MRRKQKNLSDEELLPGEVPLNIKPIHLPRIEQPKSLLSYLKRTGQMQVIQAVKIRTAQTMYVRDGKSIREISSELDIRQKEIRHWINIFDWEEERESLDFEAYKKISNKKIKKPDVDSRANRIAGSIEQVLEETLNAHNEALEAGDMEGILSTKDLQTLAATLERTYKIRSEATGQQKSKPSQKVEIEGKVDVSHAHQTFIADIGKALVDASGQNRELELQQNLLEVEYGTPQEDAEFENLEEDDD